MKSTLIRTALDHLDIVNAGLELMLEAKANGQPPIYDKAAAIYRACREKHLVSETGRVFKSRAMNDLERQCLMLIERGWVVDPATQTIHYFRRDGITQSPAPSVS